MSGWRRPVWWTVALTLVAALLFVRLGVWQLDRAQHKEALVRRYAAAAVAPLQDFATVEAKPPADRFGHVQLRGHYLRDRVYLLDNPRHDERGGVEVYAPLQLQGQQRLLLIDLGFVPGNGNDATPSLPPLPDGTVRLRGLYLPPPGAGFEMGGDALRGQAHWPKTSIYLDLDQVADDLGRPLYPHVLALDPDPASIYVRQRHYDFSSMPPARHRAYAFQWFSFALAVVAILVILHRPRRTNRTDRP